MSTTIPIALTAKQIREITSGASDSLHLTEAQLKSAWGEYCGNRGGRPKKVRPCPFGCGAQLGVVDMRAHTPVCPAKP